MPRHALDIPSVLFAASLLLGVSPTGAGDRDASHAATPTGHGSTMPSAGIPMGHGAAGTSAAATDRSDPVFPSRSQPLEGTTATRPSADVGPRTPRSADALSGARGPARSSDAVSGTSRSTGPGDAVAGERRSARPADAAYPGRAERGDAHGGPVAAVPNDAAPGPRERVAGGVRYMTGGVSADEAATMRREASRYALVLTFASPDGAFFSDVDVSVRDARRRELLSVVSGPMLLAELPAGTYTVEATVNGRTQTQRVTVPAKGHRQVVVRFPDTDGAQPRYAVRDETRR